MSGSNNTTILCVSSYEKGFDFMKQAKEEGSRVFLLTSKSLESAPWPKESIDDIFYIQDKNNEWEMRDLIYGVSYLARHNQIDRIVALDDFDVEKAATLREHLRIPGMGDTTARYFRDKLAMRMRAAEENIPIPSFVHILNYEKIKSFINKIPSPWIIKPRSQAGAHGLKLINNQDEFWDVIDKLADQQSFYLMEQFIQGDIFHVDSIISEKEVVFAVAHKYGNPPMEIAHQGRVFTSTTVFRGSEDWKQLVELNQKVLKAMGHVRGVSHSEFIKGNDGKFYFLETSARVGGANIGELVLASTDINLWREWAKIEISQGKEKYSLPKFAENYSGILLSLSKQEYPDTSAYNDNEIFWRLSKRYHAGLIVKSKKYERVQELMDSYTIRFYNDFFATQPMTDKPTN